MSILELLYLEETPADAVISAVQLWCADNGCDISSVKGQLAMSTAVRLAKSEAISGPYLSNALAQAMAASDIVRPKHVLVVEDQPLIALDFEHTLQSEGYRVSFCATCAESLTWLATHTPDVAVIDIHLKEGPCVALAQHLLDHGIPFLISSGSAKSDEHDVFASGRWLKKPCQPDELLKNVSEALSLSAIDQMMEREG